MDPKMNAPMDEAALSKKILEKMYEQVQKSKGFSGVQKYARDVRDIAPRSESGEAIGALLDIARQLKNRFSPAKAAKLETVPTPGTAPASQTSSTKASPTIGEEATKDRTEEVRDRAHKIWEHQCKPEGKAEEHWSAAERHQDAVESIQEGVHKFFSMDAYKAKWTKDLLEAVQGGGPKEGDAAPKKDVKDTLEELAKMGGIASTLAVLIGDAVPIFMAGAAGAALGSWISGWVKNHGDFLSGKNGIFTKAFELGDKLKSSMTMAGPMGLLSGLGKMLGHKATENKNEKLVDRTTELTEKGMKPDAAARRAQAELKQTTSDKDVNKTQLKDVAMSGPMGLAASLKGARSEVKKTSVQEKARLAGTVNHTDFKMDKSQKAEYDKEMKGRFKGVANNTSDEFERKNEVSDMRKSEMQTMISAAKSGSVDETGTSQRILKEVPLNKEEAALQKELKEAIDKLHQEMAATHQTIKDGAKNGSTKTPSGYDANNTRNPFLSGMAAGVVGLTRRG